MMEAGFAMMNEFGERDIAIAALHELVSSIEREGREPDLWERFFFRDGLKAFASGRYGRVLVEIEYAQEPSSRRRADLQPKIDYELERLELAMMRRELAALKSLPRQ